MLKHIFRAKTVSFSFPKPHFQAVAKFSSQIDSKNTSEFLSIASRDQYSDDEYRRVQEIQKLTYHEILEEAKKYPDRPKTKVKITLLQFLIDQVPKKGAIPPSNNFEQFQAQTLHTKDFTLDSLHEAANEPLDENSEEAINFLNSSPLFRTLAFEAEAFQKQQMLFVNTQKTLPYLENYPEKQLREQLGQLSSPDLRREIEQFIHRSSLYSKTFPLQKVKKLTKEDLPTTFENMLFVHREYAHFYRNYLKQIISDPKGKFYTPLDCLEALRSLEDPINLSRSHSYLKSLHSNSLLKFWKVLFDSIDKYDLHTINLILSTGLNLKENYLLYLTERGKEEEIFLVLFNRAVELIHDENQSYSIVSLAGIVNNARKIQIKQPELLDKITPILKKVLIKKYCHEVLSVDYSKLTFTSQELMTVSNAVISSGGEELPILLPDIFSKLQNANIKNFEKEPLRELLILITNLKINPPKEFIEGIRDNPKMIENASFLDIYLLLHTFKEAKINFSKTYLVLYYAFTSLIDAQPYLTEMKNIILTAKIMNYVLENHLTEHRRTTIEKKTSFVLSFIEKSLDNIEDPVQVIDLMEISSLFLPHLNNPDYLFRKILLQIDELKVTNENKSKIAKFVTKFLDKIEPKYTFNTYLTNTELEFNDKLTELPVGLFRKLVQKFRESNHFSYLMLNIRISCNGTFLRALYPNEFERKNFLEYLIKQVVGLSTNSAGIGISNIKLIAKFLQKNVHEFNPNFVVIIIQKLIFQFLSHYSTQAAQFNELLEWLYDFSFSLNKLQKDALNPVNLKLQENLSKKLADFTQENIIPQFSENSSLTVQQIIYDKDVSQYFNSSVFNTNFAFLEYLLPTLCYLEIPITSAIEKNIILQFPRCIKRWQGQILVENLLFLDESKIHCPELFEYAVPNLLSCFIFYFDIQNLSLNKEILDEKIALRLLRTFMNQKEKKYFKDINNSIGQIEFSRNGTSLVPLGALLYKCMNLLEVEDINKIVNILGDERKNYMHAFINKFNHLKFPNLSVQSAIDMKTYLPTFLQNQEVNKKVFQHIQKNKEDFRQIFKIMMKEKLWIDDIIPSFIQEIKSTKSISLFNDLISYISQAAVCYRDTSSIIELIRHLNLSLSQISITTKVDLLTFFYTQQILANPENSQSQEAFPDATRDFLKQLCLDLLRTEYFFFFENLVEHNGTLLKIKYYGSFELTQDLMSNTFKVFPKNKGDTLDEMNSESKTEHDLFVNQSGPGEENLFEISRSFEEQSIKQHYQKITKQFMLYKQYSEEAGLPSENEQLEAEFLDLQNKNFNLVKFKESFANFLIDVTLILHELGFVYKTNFECETSKILIDIVVGEQKTAVIYIDKEETIYELDEEKKIYHPNNFNQMKIDTLRKAGWNVIPLIYDIWAEEFESKDRKEYDIKKKINAFKPKV